MYNLHWSNVGNESKMERHRDIPAHLVLLVLPFPHVSTANTYMKQSITFESDSAVKRYFWGGHANVGG